MPRKKISFDLEDKSSVKPISFKERDARMITDEKIYAEDSKESLIVGVAMSGEIVRILEQSVSPDHMTKIRTAVTNRIGYVNSRSLL